MRSDGLRAPMARADRPSARPLLDGGSGAAAAHGGGDGSPESPIGEGEGVTLGSGGRRDDARARERRGDDPVGRTPRGGTRDGQPVAAPDSLRIEVGRAAASSVEKGELRPSDATARSARRSDRGGKRRGCRFGGWLRVRASPKWPALPPALRVVVRHILVPLRRGTGKAIQGRGRVEQYEKECQKRVKGRNGSHLHPAIFRDRF